MRVTTAKTFITMEAEEEVNYVVDDDDALTCVNSRARNFGRSCVICQWLYQSDNQVTNKKYVLSTCHFKLFLNLSSTKLTFFVCGISLTADLGD